MTHYGQLLSQCCPNAVTNLACVEPSLSVNNSLCAFVSSACRINDMDDAESSIIILTPTYPLYNQPIVAANLTLIPCNQHTSILFSYTSCKICDANQLQSFA